MNFSSSRNCKIKNTSSLLRDDIVSNPDDLKSVKISRSAKTPKQMFIYYAAMQNIYIHTRLNNKKLKKERKKRNRSAMGGFLYLLTYLFFHLD